MNGFVVNAESPVTHIWHNLVVNQEAPFMPSNLNLFHNQTPSNGAHCEKDQKEQVWILLFFFFFLVRRNSARTKCQWHFEINNNQFCNNLEANDTWQNSQDVKICTSSLMSQQQLLNVFLCKIHQIRPCSKRTRLWKKWNEVLVDKLKCDGSGEKRNLTFLIVHKI